MEKNEKKDFIVKLAKIVEIYKHLSLSRLIADTCELDKTCFTCRKFLSCPLAKSIREQNAEYDKSVYEFIDTVSNDMNWLCEELGFECICGNDGTITIKDKQ